MTDHGDDLDLIRSILSKVPTAASFQNYTVDYVIAGGGPDGSDQPVLAIGSGFLPTPWLETYTTDHPPEEGDIALVLTVNGSPLLLGQVHGKLPTSTTAPTRSL